MSDSATPKDFRRHIGRRFRLKKLKRRVISALAGEGFCRKNAKLPIQIRIVSRFFVARIRQWKGLVNKALLEEKAGLSVSLFQRGPLVLATGDAKDQDRNDRD